MKKCKKLISVFLITAIVLSFAIMAFGCDKEDTPEPEKSTYTPISGLDTSVSVTLNIAIPYESDKGLNEVANAFKLKYPNVKVVFSYLQNYTNAAKTRILDNTIDLILTEGLEYSDSYTSITVGDEVVQKSTDDYLYDFAADTEINFSYTTPDVMDNYRGKREDDSDYLYSVPMGGRVRGVFVNVSLLKKYGLNVPTNYDEFVTCCETLEADGLIPIQGNPSTMGNNLAFGELINGVMNNDTAKVAFENADADVGQYFADTLLKLYDLTANGYYEYKTIENTTLNGMSSEDSSARQFLGLVEDKDTATWSVLDSEDENYKYSQCAFWPYINSSSSYIERLIDEYDLDTEFQFILSPLNDSDENSKAYLTPYYGLVANKNSDDLLWIREFVNFFFYAENNKLYATSNGIIPNTTDAMDYIANLYGVDKNTDVTWCGEIYFRDDYNAYTPVAQGIESFIKTNPQKYMVVLNKDADGNIVYYNDNDDKGDYLFLSKEDGTESSTKVYKADIGAEYIDGYALRSFSYCMGVFNSKFTKYHVEE